MRSFPDAVDKNDTVNFELSEMAKESIEIIKDMGIEYDDWMESSVDNMWTIRTLKIWFFLLGEWE